MILSMKAFRAGKDIQYFFCKIDDLESGFEVVSLLKAQGDVVLEAYITDDESRIELPTEVFDGQSFRVPIRRLEKQWKRVLNKPLGKGSVHTIEIKVCNHRLTATNQAQIDHLIRCIARLDVLKQRVEKTIINDALAAKMVTRYQLLIDTYEGDLAKLEMYKRRSQVKINRL